MNDGTHETPMDITENQAGAPLLSDFGAAEEIGTGSGRSNKSRRLAVMLLIVVGASGGIFLMRQVGLGAASVIASIVVDYNPNEFTTGPGDPAVLDELARSRMAVQVPAEVFEQDPFVLEGAAPAAEVVAAPVRTTITPEERAKRKLEAQIVEATEQIEVQSVMGGPIPLARVNGKMVRMGDTMLDVLTVAAIDGRVVVFIGGDTYYAYSMGEPGVQWTRSVNEEDEGGP